MKKQLSVLFRDLVIQALGIGVDVQVLLGVSRETVQRYVEGYTPHPLMLMAAMESLSKAIRDQEGI